MLPEDRIKSLSKQGFSNWKDFGRICAAPVDKHDRGPGSIPMPDQYTFNRLQSQRPALPQPFQPLLIPSAHSAAEIHREADSTDGTTAASEPTPKYTRERASLFISQE